MLLKMIPCKFLLCMMLKSLKIYFQVPKAIIPAVSTPAASVVAPQSVSPQGAVSKPRVQTATAAMTPIVPSKPTVRPVVKGPKTNESNYEKLMRNLQKMFPTRTE